MIVTEFTKMFGLQYPLALAPMGSVSGGRLAAAVSNTGALGLVGGGYGDPEWVKRELEIVSREAKRPWGFGLITWSIKREVLERALSYKPHVFFLSFGDPRPHVDAIRKAGCKLMCQVQTLGDARAAREAGADVIVAQGTEAGGHGGVRATLPLVPAIVDLVAPTPVLAAGGIVDGRGVAAALMLGAEGALLGTRFYATPEALGSQRAKERLVEASGDDTARTHIYDIVRGHDWPTRHTGRAVRNRFFERWHGRETALADVIEAERATYQQAVRDEDCDTTVIWGSEAVDLITSIEPAAALVKKIGDDAEARLKRGAALVK